MLRQYSTQSVYCCNKGNPDQNKSAASGWPDTVDLSGGLRAKFDRLVIDNI